LKDDLEDFREMLSPVTISLPIIAQSVLSLINLLALHSNNSNSEAE